MSKLSEQKFSTMNTHPHEIVIIYDSSSTLARQTLAYARTLSPHIKEWEYQKTPFTTTIWKQLLFQLNMEPKELLDKSHPYYQQNIKGRSYDDEGWLYILKNNTYLIKSPIVVKGKKAILCTNPTQIFSLLQDEIAEAEQRTVNL